MRQPRKDRGKTKKRRKNPTAGIAMDAVLSSGLGNLMVQAALHGATFTEKSIVATIVPGLLSIIRNKGKFGPNEHWDAFKPHCPQICGVPCPSDCQNSKEARFDGCHVCDCLHPKKTKEG